MPSSPNGGDIHCISTRSGQPSSGIGRLEKRAAAWRLRTHQQIG